MAETFSNRHVLQKPCHGHARGGNKGNFRVVLTALLICNIPTSERAVELSKCTGLSASSKEV